MSLFRSTKPKVTLLFQECLGEIIAQQPDLMIGLAIELAAQDAGLVKPDIEAIAQRLMVEAPKADTPARQPASRKPNGYGAHYTTWLNSLKADQLCLWLADYDVQRARTLYCDTDMDLVKAMVELKTAHTWQDLRTRFEACLLGFGGQLKGQADNVHTVDMTDNQSVESMIDQMKKLGF